MNDVAQFMSALRAAVPTQPDPTLSADLVPRLAATARASTLEAETRAARALHGGVLRSRLALVARVAVAVAAIPLLLASLAFAGVTLPEGARDAFERVGIELPNQPGDDAGTKAVPPAAAPAKSRVGGASNGGNSAEAHQHAREQRQKAQGKAIGHERGKAIGLNEATPPGQSGETGPPAHSNAGGSPKSDSAPGQVKSTHVPRGNAWGPSK